MTTVRHPAPYSKGLIPLFSELLVGYSDVLDPFAGIGRIHELEPFGYNTHGVELEPEWAAAHERTVVGNALFLPWADNTFDAICTSPTYGNRMADHHDAKDGSERRTYKHDLGRDLHKANSGQMQWGPQYRDFHVGAWKEARRVLIPGGRFVLNIKDHIRKGKRQYVAGWHVSTLSRLGFTLEFHIAVETPGMRKGANAQLRLPSEEVYVFALTSKKGTFHE